MNNPVCPQTGLPMKRDVRPITIAYRGESITFNMPGWYTDVSDEGVHTGEDMKVSDRMLTAVPRSIEPVKGACISQSNRLRDQSFQAPL